MEIMMLIKLKVKKIYNKILSILKITDGNFLYYISGSETLPPPLSTEEENEALEKLMHNDESVRKVLVERNLRLVVYIAKKFENTKIGIEDLISIGTIRIDESYKHI